MLYSEIYNIISAHPNANQRKRAKYSQMSKSLIQAYWATFPQIAFVLFSSKKSQLHEAECTHGKRCISVNCHWFSFSSTQVPVPQWALQKAPHRRALRKAPPQQALCELPPRLFYGLLLQFHRTICILAEAFALLSLKAIVWKESGFVKYILLIMLWLFLNVIGRGKGGFRYDVWWSDSPRVWEGSYLDICTGCSACGLNYNAQQLQLQLQHSACGLNYNGGSQDTLTRGFGLSSNTCYIFWPSSSSSTQKSLF